MKTRLCVVVLCVAMLLTLIPATAQEGDQIEVAITVGAHGTVFIGEPPENEGDPDDRDFIYSETRTVAIDIDGDAENTKVFIEVKPDGGYEIESITLGEETYEVGAEIETTPGQHRIVEEAGFIGEIPVSLLIDSDGNYVISVTFKVAEGEPGSGGPSAGTFDVNVEVGEHGEIRINEQSITHEDGIETVVLDANHEGPDLTYVFISIIPDANYEILSVTLGDREYGVDDTIYEHEGFIVTVAKQGIEDKGIPASLLKTDDETTYFISATFQEATEEPGGGDQGGGGPGDEGPGDGNVTITLDVGDYGSVESVTRKVGLTDEPVSHDAENVNTYTVPRGSDVTITFEPDEGYIIDQIWVDGGPAWADLENRITLHNVQGNQTVKVTFTEPEEFIIKVPQVDHVEIEIFNNGEPVELIGSQFTSKTRDMVRYNFQIETGYKIKELNIRQDDGWVEGVFTDFDSEGLYAEVETNFNYELLIEAEKLEGLPTQYYAILNSEAEEPDVKMAIRRELALQGVFVSDDDIEISEDTPPVDDIIYMASEGTYSGTDVGYMEVTVGDLGTAYFFTVDNAKTLLIMLTDSEGNETSLTVFDGSEVDDIEPVDITIPAISSGKIYAFGPYAAFAMDMSHAIGLDIPVSADYDGSYIVAGEFYNMQWHVVNKGNLPETRVNWYPANIITEDAMYIEAGATKGSSGSTQRAGKWDIDTSPRIYKVDDDGTLNYRLDVFFGNDTVTIKPPAGGNVTGVAYRTESDSPGYTFKNNPDSSVEVTFHSDFYDNITVPLTLTLKDGVETRDANVTIHRLGVEIQEHIFEDRPGGEVSRVAHGTQNGSLVDLRDYRYRLTATYYIPDGGNTAPYGLFVTRTYSNGRVETETILGSIQGVIGHGGAASAVDYIIYSGTNKATAPVSVSVLVLKVEPEDDTFGGVSFGSGAGVTWTKD
jgi:hypothetical protein